MSFFSLIARNLFRQPTRALLTVLGIAIGITTVVALGSIVAGLKVSSEEILRAGGADFMVGQRGASDLTFSTVTEEEWREIDARPDVERALGVLIDISRVGGNAFFVTMGVDADQLREVPLTLLEGALLGDGPDEVMLGDRAARELDAAAGDTIVIHDRPLTIVGIYRTGNLWQDSGAYAQLATMQELTGRAGTITAVFVDAAPGLDPAEVASGIEQDMPQLVAIVEQSEYGEIDQGFRIIDAANLAISVLAVGIGAIGVMNTMVMSVVERTREIGILRAVGWSGRRILQMIVGESVILCLIAVAAGSLLGVLLSRAVLVIEEVRSFLEPQYPGSIFLRALIVGIAVGLAGALYPALRAVRLTPMEALRHE
jgi:putative ABC transport system permease protein